MFGYLIAAADVLEENQKQRYKACYCGLCRSLEKCYGQAARLTLNYDVSFLVLLLSSLYEPEESRDSRRCLRHPLEAQHFVTSEISDYAAGMNVALAYLKCLDNWHDDKKLSALTEAKLLENISKMRDKTCIIVTHRRAALNICDYALHIADGKMTQVSRDNPEEG